MNILSFPPKIANFGVFACSSDRSTFKKKTPILAIFDDVCGKMVVVKVILK